MPAKKTKKKAPKILDLPTVDRARAYMEANAALLEKHGLNSRIVISKGEGKRPGIIIKFALWVLRRAGAFVDIEFSPRVK